MLIDDPMEKRWSILANYLSISERSPLWLKQYLKRHECPPAWCEEFTKRAYEQNFLSTKRYAEIFLAQAQKKGNKPFWLLKKELQRRGIPAEDIPANVFDDSEALKLVLKKLSKKKWEPAKLKQSLLRKGFSSTLIREALAKAQS